MSTTKDKEDEDSSTKQILEYYRKYSQSRDLPKYFSGSVQYLPKIVDDDDEESIETRTINNIKVTESEIENCGPNIELSPTGSTTSNRKLEWDSLGDIGYIQRSASLPILTREKRLETKEQKGNNIKIVILPYTSSSEVSIERNTLQSSLSSPLEEKCIPTTSSSISKEQQRSSTDLESPQSDKKITEFQQSLDSIKKKIGLPGAHSTPYDSQSWNNKKITKKPKDFENSIEQFKQDDSDKASINKEKVDADGSKEIDKPSKKVVNLCLTKPLLLDCLSHTNTKKLTIGIQTDDSLQVPKQPHQLVTYYKHYDTLKVSSDSAKSTSSNAVASKCDSFEYIKNDSNDVKLGNNDAPVENLELTKSNKINDPVKSESSPQSENDLKTNDIERGVYVLQRLIKSKRYDSTTKKRYIKKVLQKITESKYLDDSSTSSDLFYPKVPQDHRKNLSTSHQSQEERKSPKKIKSVSTGSDLPYRKENKASPSKKIASSSVKEPSKKEQAAKETKKTLFTVTNCQEISSDQSSCSPQSYQNWKKLKTLSEKVFESNGQTIGGGDQISQFVNKERDYQLNWINKEIDHLGKLKHMLEKRKKPCYPPECMKKTSVYMVAAGNNEIERNYIIETKLGMPSSVRRNFILNGESYTVKNPRQSDEETDQNVVTDIQVLSTDKTTNIKVTTFCKICKRAPCVCVTNFLQGISNPFEINHKAVKEHLDINSKSCTCSSNSTSSSNTTPSGKESSKTICIVCHRYPCTCCSCKQTHSVKTCSVCQLYSCMCVISPKESATLEPYVGTFIPTTRMEQNTDKPEEILCCNCEISPCNCGSSTTSSTNSLTKVFIDCKCGPSSECQCPFVDKLLQHFNNENFKSEKSKIGTCTLRKKSTTGTYNKQSTSTYTLKNFKNLPKEDQCVCTKEEKAVDPTNIYSTEDKSIGKTVKESVTQNGVKFKTADKAVSSRKTTSDKGVECDCETTVCDKGIGTNNKKPCVDRSTSPRTCLVDKGTACDPKGSQVDQCTSPKCSQMDKGTACDPKGSQVDQCTSPKCSQMDKGTTRDPKGSQVDQCTAPKCSQMEKGTTSDPKGLKVDQCTSPKCSQIDKGTTSDPKGLKVDQCTSPKCSQIDKGTTSNIRGVSVDQCTSCTPILIDRGTGYSPRILLDKYTSCAPRIERGVVSETRTFVDKCVSPTRFNIDKETEWISGRISRDQGTTTGCSQMDRRTENYTKSLLNQCAATMFASGENRDEMTKDAYKEPRIGVRTERIRPKSPNKCTNVNKSTITSNEVCVGPDYKYIQDSKRRENDSSKLNKNIQMRKFDVKTTPEVEYTSVDVQTDLLSKNICTCSSGSKEKLKKSNDCKLRKKKSKNEIFCLCKPKTENKKIYKIICLDDNSRKCCICSSSCRKRTVRSRSSSPSDSRNRRKFCCHCNSMKCGAKHKIKPISVDVSETDDSTTTNSSSNCTCCCCETSVPLERISILRSGDQEFPICRECFDKRPVLTTVYITDDESSSNNQNSKDFIRRHLNFCTCKKDSKDFEYCSHCKNRLRKTQQSRNGIAYTLTLEDEPLENFKTRTKKKLKKLEEIKIKIPNPYSRKQHKNMENNHKKDEDRMKKIESGENSENERLNEETSLKSSDATDNENNCTLQEYLKRNRPGFVNAAEYRRLAMMNNRIERELNKDDLKLKFLEKNAQNNKLKREKLFSEKEMREITRRNYKKLPEVQQKLIDKRVQKLRNADKFMADMLKKKIQNCVLKGKSSFPIDTNIINVYN